MACNNCGAVNGGCGCGNVGGNNSACNGYQGGSNGCSNCGGYWKVVKVWQAVEPKTVAIRCADCCGNGVAGAVLTLKSCGKFYSAVSGDCGWCYFTGVCPGNYTLTQASAPAGYQTNCGQYNCKVCNNGASYVNGQNSSCVAIKCAKLPEVKHHCGCGGGYVDPGFGVNPGYGGCGRCEG
ncbi:MAG: prealbumin-like fold domain-containing protein [Oscillospiraceae bacterium]|jgi:hypothetical protein|nr:prealbumin-like fold domain-containing protein [Oscillospiraceae bacterium]